jgi:hypothetical protein
MSDTNMSHANQFVPPDIEPPLVFRPAEINTLRNSFQFGREWVWHGYLATANITLITSQ